MFNTNEKKWLRQIVIAGFCRIDNGLLVPAPSSDSRQIYSHQLQRSLSSISESILQSRAASEPASLHRISAWGLFKEADFRL